MDTRPAFPLLIGSPERLVPTADRVTESLTTLPPPGAPVPSRVRREEFHGLARL